MLGRDARVAALLVDGGELAVAAQDRRDGAAVLDVEDVAVGAVAVDQVEVGDGDPEQLVLLAEAAQRLVDVGSGLDVVARPR